MKNNLIVNSLSYRDPASKIYEEIDDKLFTQKIFRGLRKDFYINHSNLLNEKFFIQLMSVDMVVKTQIKNIDETEFQQIKNDRWEGLVEHEKLDFISYPFEWSFSMLKDAALLHLFITRKSIENFWQVKDSSSFNIQWKNNKPIFIDTASFLPINKNFEWKGYNQFVSMFLNPLLIKSYINLNFNDILKSNLNGIPPQDAIKYFQFLNKFRKGIFSHLYFPELLKKFLKKNNKSKKIKQKKENIINLIYSMENLIQNLSYQKKGSIWLGYDKKNSYEEKDKNIKKNFILKNITKKQFCLWDMGCNNGYYSKILKEKFEIIISFDYDHEVIEDLYNSEKKENISNIYPLVINFSNQSPAQGWNSELKRLENRSQPNCILCLAFIHHARISMNIPLKQLIEWLSKLNSSLIIEYVDRHDEMVEQLLENKDETYEDYNKNNFIRLLEDKFKVIDRKILKNGKRELFYCVNQNA